MDFTQPAHVPTTYHTNSHGGFYTMSLFWDFSCVDFCIHSFTKPDWLACGDCREEASEARVNEVLCSAYERLIVKDLNYKSGREAALVV